MKLDSLRLLRRQDTLNRTPQTVEFENLTVLRRSPVTIADLSGGRAPKRHDILKYPELYAQLAAKPVDVLTITDKATGKEQHAMVFPPVNGLEANFVLHAAAAHKFNGLNTDDIIYDWLEFSSPISEQESQRQHLHRNMPGWNQFTNNGEGNKVIRLLTDYFDHPYPVPGTEDAYRLVPIVRWTIENGHPEIILDPLETEMADAIAKTLPHKILNTYQLDPILGLPFIATFSPEITIDRYGGYNPSRPTTTIQDMGPGQMMPYFFLKIAQGRIPGHEIKPERDIEQSFLLNAAAEFSQSGVLPSRQRDKTKSTAASIIRDRARREFDGLDPTKTTTYKIPGGGLSIQVEPHSTLLKRTYGLSLVSGVRIAEITDDASGKVDERTVYEYSGTGPLGEHIELKLQDTPNGTKITFSTPTKTDRRFRTWKPYHRRAVQETFGISF